MVAGIVKAGDCKRDALSGWRCRRTRRGSTKLRLKKRECSDETQKRGTERQVQRVRLSMGIGLADHSIRAHNLLEYIWIDKCEDCIRVLCGHKFSLYTGRPSGQRMEDCPPSRCSGTQSCPDATSGLLSPDADCSDTQSTPRQHGGWGYGWTPTSHSGITRG